MTTTRLPRFTARLIRPTPEQLAIQTLDADAILVSANAGAAKTTSLALRIGEALAYGVGPKSILALTYTEPACEALRNALLKIGVPLADVKSLWISTFERFASYCLQSSEGAVPTLLATAEDLQATVWAAVDALAQNQEGRWHADLRLPYVGDTGFVEHFLQSSLFWKGSLARDKLFWDGQRITPQVCDEQGFDFTAMSVLDAYERLRCPNRADLPDFRAPHDASYDLARQIEDPDQADWLDLFPRWPRHIQMLLVDEMHDLNAAMFAIVRGLLAVNSRCAFCGVGDVDQVLHAQAGADARFMEPGSFEQHTGRQVVQLPLTPSYRFSAAVAELAGGFAQKPYASQAGHASSVAVLTYTRPEECVQQILQQVQQWRAAKKKMPEFAVLLRHAHQSVLIENALCEAGIAYTTRGFTTYLLRPEVLLVRAVLAIATGSFESVQSATTRQRMVEELVAFCRVKLSFGMDEKESQKDRMQEAVRHVVRDPSALVPFFEGQILRNTEPSVAARLRAAVQAARESGLAGMLDALDMRRWAATLWVEQQRRADALSHLEGLRLAAATAGSAAAFFAMLNAAEVAQDAAGRRDARASAICLADIASVKGLEFEHVLLPYLEQGVFPANERRAMADEKNLFYVGMTRARSVLTLVVSSVQPSPFLGAL